MSIKPYLAATSDISSVPTETTSSSSSSSSIERVDDHIYFYSEITRDSILKLNKLLHEVAKENVVYATLRHVQSLSPIILHIQSYGGAIFSGLAAMDEILKCPVPVITVVDGCAASAATFLSIVGSHRRMSKNAYMLIHQLSSMTWGTYEQMKDDQKNNDILMAKIKEIYKKYTKLPVNKLDEILKHDLWWDAKTCLKYGLVDEIL